MKALTISQPYASLIASGEKFVENRRWATSYRGPLAIHAGKGTQYLDRHELKAYPTGCIIAVCRLVECLPLDTIRKWAVRTPEGSAVGKYVCTWRQIYEHEHTEGPFCWVLMDVKRVDPYPCKGAQGLWTPPTEGLYTSRPAPTVPPALF